MPALVVLIAVAFVTYPQIIYQLVLTWYRACGMDLSRVVTSEKRACRMIRLSGVLMLFMGVAMLVFAWFFIRQWSTFPAFE